MYREIECALWVLGYWSLVLLCKNAHHTWREMDIVRNLDESINWQESRWFPLAASKCALPERFKTIEEQKLWVKVNGPERIVDWCAPELPHARREYFSKLAKLQKHMELEALRYGYHALAAYVVGVPQRIIWYKGDLLLNARPHEKAVNSTCEVRSPLSDTSKQIMYYKNLTIKHGTLSGGEGELMLRGREACLMMELLHP